MADVQPFVTGALLTVAEVAAGMRVSNMTVYRLIKSGELPAVRVGKGYRIRESELQRFLEERSVQVEGASGQGAHRPRHRLDAVRAVELTGAIRPPWSRPLRCRCRRCRGERRGQGARGGHRGPA